MATRAGSLIREVFVDVLDRAASAEDTTLRESRDTLYVRSRLR
jgi:hypothetical protein